MSAVALDENSRPIPGAQMWLRDNTEGPNHIGPMFRTGDDGRFTFSVREGQRYEIQANRFIRKARNRTTAVHTATVPFKAARGAEPIPLVLKPRDY